MSLFFIIFFTVYSCLHIYVFFKARAAFAFGTLTAILILFFLAVMILAPVIIRLSEKQGLELFARFMSFTGYTWMGIVFLFLSASLCIDFYHLLIHLTGYIFKKNLSGITLSSRHAFMFPLMISIAIVSYGYFEAKNIRTEKLLIKTPKLPDKVAKLTIVQISDVHIGLIVREARLKKILREVRNAKPDMFVSTGDLVDGQINRLEGIAEMLREINPKYGKFAVTGNHEFYAGLGQALEFTKNAGFTVLRGESAAGIINIAGVDDPAGRGFDAYREVSEKKLLSELPSDRFTLLLKHRPVVDENSHGLFDLQVSGHVHKGQIFPFSIFTKIYYRVYAGYARLPNGSHLYVSRGSGIWGPPIRFLAPPEVTVIELVSAPVSESR